MPYASQAGEGTSFSFEGSALAGVLSVDLDGLEVAAVDNFHMNSTVKTTRPSKMVDYGKVSVEIEYDPADTGHAAVVAAWAAGTEIDWVITYDGAGTTSGSGFVTSFKIGGMGKSENNVTASFEIKNNTFTI